MPDILVKGARLATVAVCRAMLSLRAFDMPPRTGRPRVYVANHVSHADFVAIWTALPAGLRQHTRPVAGSDYWLSSPLRRWIITRVFNAVLVARGQSAAESPPQDAARGEVIGRFAKALNDSEDLIFFPEGTRNLTDAALLRLKSGIYHLMQAVPDAEVVPLWITNMDRILPKGGILPVPLNCTLTFGAPLRPAEGETAAAFLDRLRDAMLACRGDQA